MIAKRSRNDPTIEQVSAALFCGNPVAMGASAVTAVERLRSGWRFLVCPWRADWRGDDLAIDLTVEHGTFRVSALTPAGKGAFFRALAVS